MSILSKKVAPFAFLHFKDADGVPMYAENADGEPDETKPIGVNLYGPGSRQYVEVMDAIETEAMHRFMPVQMQGGKKSKRDDDEPISSRNRKVATLVKLTHSFQNIGDVPGPGDVPLSGEKLAHAIWDDCELGYLIPQADAFIGAWTNFMRGSATR